MGLAATAQNAFGQRRHPRTRLSFPGKLFLPAEDATIDCRIVDISCGGAGIKCAEPPPLQSFVLLYVEGFGRFEAVCARMVGDTLGLRFVLSDAKRRRITSALARYVDTGKLDGTALRRHRRLQGTEIAHVARSGGERVACEILDISLTGASLKTDGSFAVGESVLIGHMPARIVRLHDCGIAVVF